ncbi:MAG: secretin N-terminal domain-containing protein [Opitutus sp.]|nr:secretin N-terminal domain-containing protein [Opitutus sp.]MCS6246603.1 secretin N-terminal domain-containing protein [Opitutus sp.]MCS6274594.1 secretin N-terminal domain-containing protein [Opitutus sp.]
MRFNCLKRGLLVTFALAATSLSFAQTRERVETALEAPVTQFVVSNAQPIAGVIDTLSRTYRIPIVLDAEVQGSVTVRTYDTTLRGVLDTLCRSNGWHYSIEGSADYTFVIVRRFITRIYSVDYIQLQQTVSSSASVSVSSGTSSGGGSSSDSSGSSGSSGSSSGGGTGSSSVSLSSSTETDFWTRFETDARALIKADEIVVVNKFAGVLQVRATPETHAQIETYLNSVMKRVRRSATITVRLLRVDLNDSNKQGVNWDVTAFSIGSGNNSPKIGQPFRGDAGFSGFGSDTNFTGSVGPAQLPGDTVRAVVSSGKVSALISALKEQGNVTVENRTIGWSLNNQTTLVQVSDDRPFFTRTSETTISNVAGGNTSGSSTSSSTYQQTNISFGAILEMTPQIDDNLVTTLNIAPSLTDFKGLVQSPDGFSTAANVGVRRQRSTVVLRNGETAVLGGYISDTKGSKMRGIPGLSSIPYVGRLFRTDATISERSEFVILVTVEAQDLRPSSPRNVVLPGPGDSISPRMRQLMNEPISTGTGGKSDVIADPVAAPPAPNNLQYIEP